MSLGPTVTVTPTYATVEIDANGATVTVDVPETTVDITGVGPQGPAGTGADGYLLQAYDSTDQTAASTTVAYPIRLGTVDISDGITVANNGSSQPTRITFANDGNYDVQFSIQFVNTSASEANANVWFRKNDVDLADSNSQITVPKKHGSADGAIIMALNLIVNAAGGDYVEIMWQTESTDVSIQYLPGGTTPTTPATPSVIVTATVVRYLEVGPAGPGVPVGGTTGQYLTKTSATDYDTAWTTGGLRHIKTVTIGTGVASVVIDNVFSATYNNYRVVIADPVGSITYQTRVNITYGAATSAYYGSVYYYPAGGGSGSMLTNGGASAPLARVFNGTGTMIAFDIASPYLAVATTWIGNHGNGAEFGFMGGNQLSNTSFTSFTLTTASGTLTGGTIRVYGYCQ